MSTGGCGPAAPCFWRIFLRFVSPGNQMGVSSPLEFPLFTMAVARCEITKCKKHRKQEVPPEHKRLPRFLIHFKCSKLFSAVLQAAAQHALMGATNEVQSSLLLGLSLLSSSFSHPAALKASPKQLQQIRHTLPHPVKKDLKLFAPQVNPLLSPKP